MTKIDIVSGFLGAGKTTLIKKMVKEAYQGEKLVLIENEFGEIGIDGGFMREAGIQVNELNSGCICCSLVGDFREALKKVVETYHPDRILIEPSGVGKLSDVTRAVEGVAEDLPVILNSFVTVADVNKVKMYMKNFGEFYDDQVSHASCIILSRTGNASEEKVAAAVALLAEKNPTATIVTTDWTVLTGAQIVSVMEKESGLDREAALANMRFSFLEDLCRTSVVRPRESKEHKRSMAIDRFLTGKYTAVPCFLGIMAVIFWMTFSGIGAWLSDGMAFLVNQAIALLDHGLQALHVNAVFLSLVIDGAAQGIGSVLSFLPAIVTLFFFLSILEDTGYMARVAFVMDRPLRKLGLSGRSFVPMLVGFGCSVPAIMATRTLSSERDRRMTILLTPFMSCTAKLPIYAFFTAAFFPNYAAIVMIGLYLFGIASGILMALIFKKTKFKGKAVPFVMELPNYRMPGAKNVGHLLWDKAKDFLQSAFTVIFIATIVIWFLQNFDMSLNMVSDSQNSILAVAAGILAPIFIPVGFGDWRIVTSLISGFLAKESVVSSLTVLYGSTGLLQNSLALPGAVSLLVFCLLYTPCVAAIASVRRELGGKWAAAMVFGQCAVAWIASFLIYHIGILF